MITYIYPCNQEKKLLLLSVERNIQQQMRLNKTSPTICTAAKLPTSCILSYNQARGIHTCICLAPYFPPQASFCWVSPNLTDYNQDAIYCKQERGIYTCIYPSATNDDIHLPRPLYFAASQCYTPHLAHSLLNPK